MGYFPNENLLKNIFRLMFRVNFRLINSGAEKFENIRLGG